MFIWHVFEHNGTSKWSRSATTIAMCGRSLNYQGWILEHLSNRLDSTRRVKQCETCWRFNKHGYSGGSTGIDAIHSNRGCQEDRSTYNFRCSEFEEIFPLSPRHLFIQGCHQLLKTHQKEWHLEQSVPTVIRGDNSTHQEVIHGLTNHISFHLFCTMLICLSHNYIITSVEIDPGLEERTPLSAPSIAKTHLSK